jgi:hypothetical protein
MKLKELNTSGVRAFSSEKRLGIELPFDAHAPKLCDKNGAKSCFIMFLVSFYDLMGAKKACKLRQPNCQAMEKANTFQRRHQTLKPPSLRSPVVNFIALLADRFLA